MPKTKKRSLRQQRAVDKLRKQEKVVPGSSLEKPLEPVVPHLQPQSPVPQTSSGVVEAQHPDIFHGLNPSSVLTGYIDIQVLDYFSALLRAHYPDAHGLLEPSILYQQHISNENIHTEQLVPEGADAVQIHFLNDHYLVSTKKNETITVFDSLKNPNRVKCLIPQLRRIYGNLSKVDIKYVVAQSQGTSDDCGAFAAANAYFIVNGKSLCQLILDQNALRRHLKLCLQSGTITDFPNERKKNCDVMLINYFQDQAQRKSEKQTELLNNTTKPDDHEYAQYSVKNKQTEKQRKWRLKELQLHKEYAKQKRANEQRKVRQKHREQNTKEFKHKQSVEKNKVRQKHKEQNLKEFKHKRSVETNKVRQKHKEQNLKEFKHKRSVETNKVRQKHKQQNLKEFKHKQSVQKSKVRQKHKEQNLKEFKHKRSVETNKVRQKHKEQNLKEFKHKRSVETNKVRQKHKQQNLKELRHKQSIQKSKVRQKHREQNLKEFKHKQSVEKNKVRQKHSTSDPKKAKKKRAEEQQTYRRKEYDMQKASIKFTENINQYPEYVCTCCSRMLYKRTVVCVENVSFKRASSNLLTQCLSPDVNAEGKRWICQTCLRYIRQNKMPPQSDANNLKLPSIPENLQDLSTLEQRLLSQRYPFMKLLALPKGRQNAIKGAVVNIPVEVNTVTETLPRTPQKLDLFH